LRVMPMTSLPWHEGVCSDTAIPIAQSLMRPSFYRCKESTKYMSPTVMSQFMDGAIRDRINVRLLAEEHIAISRALEQKSRVEDFLGVVHTRCSPTEITQVVGNFVTDLCEATMGTSPRIEMDGHADASFASAKPISSSRVSQC
jgi:hypothetical protein